MRWPGLHCMTAELKIKEVKNQSTFHLVDYEVNSNNEPTTSRPKLYRNFLTMPWTTFRLES